MVTASGSCFQENAGFVPLFPLLFGIQANNTDDENTSKCLRDCPDHWEKEKDRCFLWPQEKKTWTKAEEYCKQSDGHLASITSEEIHKYLYSKVDWYHHEKLFWVGGTDQEKENNWRWTDGSPWTFAEWGENQPDKGSEENCLQIERMERPIL